MAYFLINTDPVTKIKVKGHQQWYRCVEHNGGYTKFDFAQIHGFREKPNVKFLDMARQSAGQTNTDKYIDSCFNFSFLKEMCWGRVKLALVVSKNVYIGFPSFEYFQLLWILLNTSADTILGVSFIFFLHLCISDTPSTNKGEVEDAPSPS